ncbi:MAG TPA: nucleotide-binding protein [Tepidisphaeraceae bacterium]|nr:nucleotide-binding protein [Tepidisphaeraceae bacterium]
MARAKHQAPQKGSPEVSPQKGVELLNRQIEKGKALLQSRPVSEADESTWTNVTRDFICKAFGADTEKCQEVFPPGGFSFIPLETTEAYWETRRAERIQEGLTGLSGLVEVLRTEMELSEGTSPPTHGSEASRLSTSRKVFIVHGHDGETKLAVARLLETVRVDAIILHEKPNEGKTLIEKFEHHADVGYAVVLLTADDTGGVRGAPVERQKARARQNVIFELGYFIGRIGRGNVCALYETGVELPTDISGVAYIPLDAGGAWRFAVADELHAVGFEIDYNLLRRKK